LILFVAPATFAGQTAAPATAQAKKTTARDCGGGISVLVTPTSAAQGGLLRLDVRGRSALSDVKGEWTQHDAPRAVPFWPDAQSKMLFHGLLGVDLEKPPGKYDLALGVQPAAGDAVKCSIAVSVTAGKFSIEKLTVAPQFVHPNPEDTKRVNEEDERLRAIFTTATPEKLWRGAFRTPLPGIHTAKNFGRRRVLNGEAHSPHSGVDIPAPEGTPIHASQRGRVVVAENLYFSGNTVVIDHGLGVYTFYGHMSAIGVQAGDVVAAGAVLGKVGATGRATGPHLHWGLTVDDSRVNALQIVGVAGG
jgi:murein DD-endopeptidase MepM/ murein hydrolase activator NlpD